MKEIARTEYVQCLRQSQHRRLLDSLLCTNERGPPTELIIHRLTRNLNLDQKQSKQVALLSVSQSVERLRFRRERKKEFRSSKLTSDARTRRFRIKRTYVCILQFGPPRRRKKRNIEKKKRRKNTRTEESNNPAADSDFHTYGRSTSLYQVFVA